MKNYLALLVLALATGCNACGHKSQGNEVTGQVKKVVHNTPLLCPAYVTADISLGVMKNGVGSMSKDDLWVQVMNDSDVKLLETAAKNGDLVTMQYDVPRVTICWDDHQVSSVAIVK